MADTYGVTPDEIAKELPKLFRGGFTSDSTPDVETVATFISDADALATLTVTRATGTYPAPSDDTASIARRYIIDRVLGRIIRLVYTGNAPADVASAAAPYEVSAKDLLASLAALQPDVTVRRSVGWAGAPSGVTINQVVW